MTPEETALAAEVAALPGWRWVPGMLVCVPGDRGHVTAVLDGDEGVTVYVCFDEETRSCRFDEEIGLLPDLHDPATAGCLLGMLHAVSRGVVSVTWYHLGAMTVCGNPAWGVSCLADGRSERINTEGEHLGVAAARALVATGRAS